MLFNINKDCISVLLAYYDDKHIYLVFYSLPILIDEVY